MDPQSAKYIGAGLATISMLGAGIGVGNVWSSYISSVARNPSARDAVTVSVFIGFAVTEAIALFAFVIAMIILFK